LIKCLPNMHSSTFWMICWYLTYNCKIKAIPPPRSNNTGSIFTLHNYQVLDSAVLILFLDEGTYNSHPIICHILFGILWSSCSHCWAISWSTVWEYLSNKKRLAIFHVSAPDPYPGIFIKVIKANIHSFATGNIS
jgi:hypothetical protein